MTPEELKIRKKLFKIQDQDFNFLPSLTKGLLAYDDKKTDDGRAAIFAFVENVFSYYEEIEFFEEEFFPYLQKIETVRDFAVSLMDESLARGFFPRRVGQVVDLFGEENFEALTKLDRLIPDDCDQTADATNEAIEYFSGMIRNKVGMDVMNDKTPQAKVLCALNRITDPVFLCQNMKKAVGHKLDNS